ncbi:MAG: hypothetical protein LBC92_03870, partial [Rickettsiales bacterium]|nr:hypothetical protein [Rickettsiales bacterium]
MYSNNYSSKETLEHRINYVINWKRTINGKDYNLQQIADALLEGDTKVGEDSHDFIQPMFPIYTVGMDGKAYFENEEEFQRFEESVGYLENGILNKYLESYLTYIGFPPGKEPDKNNMIYKNVENGRYDHNFARITRVIESVCLQARALLMGFIHDSMDKTDKIRDEVEQNKNIKQVENAIKAVSMADEFYRELIDVAEKNPNISSDTLKFWRNNSLVKDASYLLSSLRQKKGNLIKNNPIISADEFFYCEKCNNLLDGQEIIFKQKKDAEIFRLLSMSGNDFAFKRDVIRRAINSGVITNRGIFFEDIIKAAND